MNQAETHQGPHVASVKLLLVVWVALIFGTWLTVSVTYFDFGAFNIIIGLGIATAKAVLVALYYMHLRWDKPFNAFIFISAFAFLSLMIGLMLMDTSQNQPDMIPGFGAVVESGAAPEMP
ncbi:MAG: cytochrome C oxidase subunit IV family protein [Acidobacteria bacterium]|nr:cytochrome C oxidase subunit IV family protein [Acidobacteriota bacterium]